MPADSPQVTIVIPARHASSRFPGKPLALLAGKPLIQHVYEQAVRVPKVAEVLVATDDARIHESVEQFGGRSTMVTTPCRTGTDRVAEAIRQLPCEIVVNLQADEILLSPDLLLDLIDPFLAGDRGNGHLASPSHVPGGICAVLCRQSGHGPAGEGPLLFPGPDSARARSRPGSSTLCLCPFRSVYFSQTYLESICLIAERGIGGGGKTRTVTGAGTWDSHSRVGDKPCLTSD